jgi:hypothetical protein
MEKLLTKSHSQKFKLGNFDGLVILPPMPVSLPGIKAQND